MAESTSPLRLASALEEFWSPRVIAELDDYYVKVARIHGVFGWHCHAHEDELFFVLAGDLRIDMEAGPVTLTAGDMFVVPKGVQHNPCAQEECLVMLIERKSTLHAGTEANAKARSLADQLRPL